MPLSEESRLCQSILTTPTDQRILFVTWSQGLRLKAWIHATARRIRDCRLLCTVYDGLMEGGLGFRVFLGSIGGPILISYVGNFRNGELSAVFAVVIQR